MPEWLYKNAPLVEVIAQLRWPLTPVSSLPGAAIDPFFAVTSEHLQVAAGKRGFVLVERLLPEGVPLELVGRVPVWRYRQSRDSWPLYQLGPGMFSMNVTPPYAGWPSFRETLSAGLDDLLTAFPSPERLLRIDRIGLKYIDGFVKSHGLEEFQRFVAEELGIGLHMRDGIVSTFGQSPVEVRVYPDVRLRLRAPEGGIATIKVQPGKRDGQAAAIMELSAHASGNRCPNGRDAILSWMDAAHESLHGIFEAMTSDALKTAMGPKEDIGGAHGRGATS